MEQVIYVLWVLICLSLFVVLPIIALYGLCKWLRTRWNKVGSQSKGKRIAIVLAGMLAVCSPYLLFKVVELRSVLSRVPEPLHVSWIEYRLEDHPGLSGPGDEESGLVIYRLTKRSAVWARSQGSSLGKRLPGGAIEWRLTPVDDKVSVSLWHHDHYTGRPAHQANIQEYLQKYGGISVDEGVRAEVNDAIRKPGSFYSYGRAGSITIVDPNQGKIYFAYAG